MSKVILSNSKSFSKTLYLALIFISLNLVSCLNPERSDSCLEDSYQNCIERYELPPDFNADCYFQINEIAQEDCSQKDTLCLIEHYQNASARESTEYFSPQCLAPYTANQWVAYSRYSRLSKCDSVKISANEICDRRDGTIYPIAKVGDQTWLAKNLVYGKPASKSARDINDKTIEYFCYNDDEEFCEWGGGLYSWADALALPNGCNSQSCQIEGDIQGACPHGYRLPNQNDWQKLFEHYQAQADSSQHLGKHAKGISDLKGFFFDPINDRFKEFDWNNSIAEKPSTINLLPFGFYSQSFSGSYHSWGKGAKFWSTENSSATLAYAFHFTDNPITQDMALSRATPKVDGQSIRCIKGEADFTFSNSLEPSSSSTYASSSSSSIESSESSESSGSSSSLASSSSKEVSSSVIPSSSSLSSSSSSMSSSSTNSSNLYKFTDTNFENEIPAGTHYIFINVDFEVYLEITTASMLCFGPSNFSININFGQEDFSVENAAWVADIWNLPAVNAFGTISVSDDVTCNMTW